VLTQRIVWGAMTLSQVLLLVALGAALTGPPVAGPNPLPFIALAGLLALGATLYQTWARSENQLRALGQSASGRPAERQLEVLAQSLVRALVGSLALSEAVALVGFAFAFLSNDMTRFSPFLGAGLALNLLAFPRPRALLERLRELCPQLAAFALLLAVLSACSFRGGDFTPMPKEPETPCSREAEEICKGKLGSADIGNCLAREKYRCELQEQNAQPDTK
jgi:hypothetical protein